jgi:hypothetical protein
MKLKIFKFAQAFSVMTILSLTTFLFSVIEVQAEVIELVLKNHRYIPDVIKVKAGERFKIRVTNTDPTSEEFESRDMIIEKFIAPKKSILMNMGPLKKGTYEFYGCFNRATAQGKIIAE